jgi:hypothetical protein
MIKKCDAKINLALDVTIFLDNLHTSLSPLKGKQMHKRQQKWYEQHNPRDNV